MSTVDEEEDSSIGPPIRPNPSQDPDTDVFRLNCPGGRIGVPRLEGVQRLLTDMEGVELLVSRRQSLIVKGSFDRTPSFLHRELSSDSIQGPNVKAYPVLYSDSWIDAVLNRLDDLQQSAGAGRSLSVSFSPYLRGELRRDDICLIYDHEGKTFRTDSGAWGEPPRELLPPFPAVQFERALDALRNVLPESPDPLSKLSFSSFRRSLLRAFNQSTAPEHESVPPGDFTVVHENEFVNSGTPLFGNTEFTVLSREFEDGDPWILITLEMGCLPLSLLKWLISECSRLGVNHLRWTPEQNILFRLRDHSVEELTPPSSASDQGWSSFSRITTCPGSHFCRLAHAPPVEIARRIHQSLTREAEMRDRWVRTPVGITGCGETERLERLRPIGITPDPEGGYRLYTGGNPHGEGHSGDLKQTGLDTEDLIRLIQEQLTE